MDKFKAPRRDGFGVAFFQNNSYIVKDDVCNAIRSFLSRVSSSNRLIICFLL